MATDRTAASIPPPDLFPSGAASRRPVDSIWFQRGRPGVRTAFVLSAPGRLERKQGHPAAGETGKTLDQLLVHLHRADARHFPFLCRRDYRIVNAVATVLYKRETRRTEAYLSQVRKPANLARLRAELAGIDYIVALGIRAASALGELQLEPDLAGVHPSLQKLNRAYASLAATPGARRLERVRLFAVDVLGSSRGGQRGAI
jgi:uracil-DNA glycosylase